MRKLHLFSILVALVFATTTLWATPAAADANGKLPGKFTVACGEQVYFSQGNLQAVFASAGTSECTWQFADEQYIFIGNATANNAVGNNQVTTAGTVDYFGWVGESASLPKYGINNSTTGADYGNVNNEKIKEDWGSTMGAGWRTLTNAEWLWLLGESSPSVSPGTNCRTSSTVGGVANARYAKAKLFGTTRGLIIFPDIYTHPDGVAVPTGINKYDATSWDGNQYNATDWDKMEKAGCVFLPLAGRRSGTNMEYMNAGYYWASTSTDSGKYLNWTESNVKPNDGGSRSLGLSVRLVQDVDPEDETPAPIASVTSDPCANNLTFTGGAQYLVTDAGTATGGTVKFRYKSSSDAEYSSWSTTRPKATNAGNYIVQWFVDHTGRTDCYVSSEVDTLNVTIKRSSTSAPSPMPTIAAATSLTYNGSAQNLVTTTGSIQLGYTTVYSTDGVNWSEDILQGTNAGNYTVYYKFHYGTNNEYVPSPNTINASIAKADLSVDLPASTSTIPHDGAAHTLLKIDPVADCVIWYKLGDNDWTDTPPTATDADEYSVQYKIVPNDQDNYNTIGPNTVTVTIFDYPFVADNADPTTKLTELLNTTSDLRVKRIIYADDEYNTICLPFALDASALASSELAGYNRLKAFRGAQVSGTGRDLSIDIFVEDATAIEAGVPYLISYPSAHPDIKNPVFEDITVTTTTPGFVSADGVTFQGMFAQVHIDPYSSSNPADYLFLGANSQLNWPRADETSPDVKMRGFRAYFIIDRTVITPAQAPAGTRARFVNAPKQPTAIENTELNTQAQKLLENGQLIILKNGIKYNAQGQVLK